MLLGFGKTAFSGSQGFEGSHYLSGGWVLFNSHIYQDSGQITCHLQMQSCCRQVVTPLFLLQGLAQRPLLRFVWLLVFQLPAEFLLKGQAASVQRWWQGRSFGWPAGLENNRLLLLGLLKRPAIKTQCETSFGMWRCLHLLLWLYCLSSLVDLNT